MTLSLFAQYAIVVSLFTIGTSIVIFAIKSWFDGRRFSKNLIDVVVTNEIITKKMLADLEKSFDDHVMSTPGMQNPYLN